MRITLRPLFQKNSDSTSQLVALPAINQQPVQKAAAETEVKQVRRDTLRYVIRLLNRHLTGQYKVFLLAFIMLVAEASMSVLEAYPLAFLIDYLFELERMKALNLPELATTTALPAFLSHPDLISRPVLMVALLTAAIVVMTMVNSLGDSLSEIFLAKGGQMLGYNLRIALYKQLQRLSLAFHDRRRTGDILTRITGDINEIEDFVTGSLSDIFGGLLVLFGTLFLLFTTSWQFALLALIIIPVMAVVSNYFSKRIKSAAKEQRSAEGDLASASQEMLASIRVIQTYSRGDHDLKRFAKHNEQNVAAAFRLAVLQARFSWVVSVAQALAIAGTVWLWFWLFNFGVLSVGTLVLITQLIQKMFKPTRKIIKEWNTIAKVYASVERIGELLDREPAVSDSPDAVPAPSFRGHLQFQRVNFTYPLNRGTSDGEEGKRERRQALTDVDFEVQPGGVMALVGHTGAGKSTIIQLLPRLYDPDTGCVRIDGADVRNFTLESLRDQISVVLQEATLFTGSVADNIAYGRTDATQEEIVQAAIQANAHSFIEQLPQGYATILGERGANLSGGQRQRIAIARAFIRNTPILILDEPTTGLDAESAELVLLALRLLMKGKTTIIISHDFKLVRHADQIVVLQDGKIEQRGTHRELLDSEGIYANLYIKQFGEIKAVEDEREDSLYDLLESPEFRHRWPAICAAFDADLMQTYLQSAMLAEEERQFEIVRCKPGKARFLADAGCLLRYSLELQHVESEERRAALLLARIFPNGEEAEIYLQQRLLPLASQMDGRAEIEPFTHPVACIDDLNMAVSVFPIDGELPALIATTDRQQMKEFFQETLPINAENPFLIEECLIETGHYGRQHRCVLRYEVESRPAEAADVALNHLEQDGAEESALRRHVIYGKVAADDRCKIVGAVLTSLQWRLDRVRTKRHFRIPQVLGYWPETGLILLEALPGRPQISEMLQARITGGEKLEVGNLNLEEALRDCACVAAALHEVDVRFSDARTFETELDDLQTLLQPVQQFSIGLAMQLQHTLYRLQAYAATTRELPMCFCHGDYTYTQLIFDEQSCGLVDFDTVCMAEPALDLGQFLAYMRLAERKARYGSTDKEGAEVELDVDALGTQFVNQYCQFAGYGAEGTEQLYARVAAYEVISLMRIALHSWQKMKRSRLEIAAELLEERVGLLPRK